MKLGLAFATDFAVADVAQAVLDPKAHSLAREMYQRVFAGGPSTASLYVVSAIFSASHLTGAISRIELTGFPCARCRLHH